MNAKYLTIAALAVMLVAATAFATTDSAFADKKGYSKSQALSQATDCGNGVISIANFCQDIGAQNQGKENSVAQSGNQQINVNVDLGFDINEPGDIVICHRPPGNPENAQTLNLSERAANAHLEQNPDDT
jgi:hypothetical protein